MLNRITTDEFLTSSRNIGNTDVISRFFVEQMKKENENQTPTCIHCGNKDDFETFTEEEYSDGSGDPNTSNHLVEVTYFQCCCCGEIL